ncbi:MAG: dihydrodipicolinate synthase family protein [Bacteroidota bacterium]
MVTAIVTPFDEMGSPDLPAMSALLEFQLECGVDAIFALGTSGEGLLLSEYERRTIAEAVVEWVDGRVPVVIHCGTVDTRSAVALAEHATLIGASAVSSIGPLFHSYSETDLWNHFRQVSEACAGTDFLVYENPERVGYSLGIPFVLRLLRELPGIVGVKDTGDSLSRLIAYLATVTDAKVFTGNNSLVLPALMMGASGGVSTIANVAPELFAGIVHQHRKGDIEEAKRLQFIAARLHAALWGVPYIPAIKHLLAERGLPCGAPRQPSTALSARNIQLVRERLSVDEEMTEWLHAV